MSLIRTPRDSYKHATYTIAEYTGRSKYIPQFQFHWSMSVQVLHFATIRVGDSVVRRRLVGLSDDFTYGAPSLNNGIAQFKARGTENSLVGQWSR